MNLEEARRIWGSAIPDEKLLQEWVDATNERLKVMHLDTAPKGATIEIEMGKSKSTEQY
jgi:hypothetical protein